MIYELNTDFDSNELNVPENYGLYRYYGVAVLEYFPYGCFILLCSSGSPYNKPVYKYYHCIPEKIIKFFHCYLVKCCDVPDEWYSAESEKTAVCF